MKQLPCMSYVAASGVWDPDELGNHRAVIEVSPETTGDVVGVRIPWRRRDPEPEHKGVLLYSRVGRRVADVVPVTITRGSGEFLFNPVDGPGRYYLYFLPYTGTVKKPYPVVEYLPAAGANAEAAGPGAADDGTGAGATTAAGSGATASGWRTLNTTRGLDEVPAARLVALESIDEFNRFTDMELTATPDEIEALLARHADERFLVFPEERTSPIRMFDAVPHRWVSRGPAGELRQDARPGEFLVFQLGVYAARADLDGVTVRFGDLVPASEEVGGAGEGAGEPAGASAAARSVALPAERVTCFNAEGRAWDGSPFAKTITVGRGRVQPLWCGIDLPEDIASGRYTLDATVSAGGEERTTRIALDVAGPVIPRRGDDDPWRLSRLRWLDSTLGTEPTLVPPFTPVEADGRRLGVLGREIELAPTGLPGRITSRFTDDVQSTDGEPLALLARPITFAVSTAAGRELLEPEAVEVTETREDGVVWRARARAGGLRFAIDGSLDFDGTLEYRVAVSVDNGAGRAPDAGQESAGAEVGVGDISLEILVPSDVARLATGLGRKGGSVPDELDWSWSVEKNQDSVWIGTVNGGLQVTLKDEHYSRPLNTNFYHLKPLVMPVSWANDGAGGISMRRGADGYRLSCTSGARTVQPGETLRFDFRVAVTPFKPIDTERHFRTRYYHAHEPLEKVVEAGGNTLNIHHASTINPYINYPFLSADILGRYIADAHDRDLKVKLYYTVRELTTRAPELFMLKSLDGEILVHGEGGGHAWLQEHLGEDYIAAWYALRVRDTSVINGVLSRWHNFYVEGMNWLAENLEIDGVYIDDLGFGREIMKRVRRVLHRHRPDPRIDLHSANQYNPRDGYASSANLYLEHFPYLDRLWFGEYFDYDERPDYWLVEVTGIPFGLMSEMLQDGGNLWRGMLFGMTGRMPRVPTNVELWKFWDAHGLPEAKMQGFWSASCPVATGHDDVFATVYRGEQESVVAVASWAASDEEVNLTVDWDALGYDAEKATITVPEIEAVQADGGTLAEPAVTIAPGGGVLVVIERGA